VSINFEDTDAGGDGVNQQADSKFANLLDIINRGSQEIEVYVEDDPVDVEFGMFAEGQENDGSFSPPGSSGAFDSSNPAVIGPGEVVENIGIAWNGSPPGESTYTITFFATRTEAEQP
jgi:hypothetical protein